MAEEGQEACAGGCPTASGDRHLPPTSPSRQYPYMTWSGVFRCLSYFMCCMSPYAYLPWTHEPFTSVSVTYDIRSVIVFGFMGRWLWCY